MTWQTLEMLKWEGYRSFLSWRGFMEWGDGPRLQWPQPIAIMCCDKDCMRAHRGRTHLFWEEQKEKNIWAESPKAVRITSWRKRDRLSLSKESSGLKSKRKSMMIIAGYLMSCRHEYRQWCWGSWVKNEILRGQFMARGIGLKGVKIFEKVLSSVSSLPYRKAEVGYWEEHCSSLPPWLPRPMTPASMALLRGGATLPLMFQILLPSFGPFPQISD